MKIMAVKVCKQWRDMARLDWQTRKCIRINVNINNKLPSDQMLNTMITSKRIGKALTRFELFVPEWIEGKQLSFTAIAQHCPNIEHVITK